MAEGKVEESVEVPLDFSDTPSKDPKAEVVGGGGGDGSDGIEVQVATPEPPKRQPKKIVDPDEGLEKLKAQLADEKREKEEQQRLRQAADARANEAMQQAAAAQSHAQNSELTAITTGISQVKQLRDSLKAKFAAASSIGDHNAMADIQDEMAEAAANQKLFERAEQELKTRPKPAPMVNDPVEKLASVMAPRSAAWVRAHPEYATGAKYQKMLAAHNLAVADNLEPNTDAYFASIEETLKLTPARSQTEEPSIQIDTTPQKATGGRSTAPAAAPVSRSGTGNGSKPRTMTLTPEMREAARMNNMTDQEYAKYRQQLIDEGTLH